jgi:hypothetical protein
MKKISLTLIIMLSVSHFLHAQFTTAGTVTSTTNSVGIGTTTPAANLHVVDGGTNLDSDNSHHFNGGLIIQGNTGARSANMGAQLEFAIPANTDGTSIWGQGRIITVAGTANGSDATGKMIIGTRRLFNKLGAGAQWYYGNDLVIDGVGNIGIGTTTPQSQLDVAVNSIIGTGANKFNTALTLIKNGDQNGTDNSAFLIKHSGIGSNVFATAGSDLGIIRIQGFSATSANKAINSNDNFYVFTNGTVGVNTSYVPAGYQLAVNGSAIATSMTVQLRTAWPDYVFKNDYQLPSLTDVKAYIDQNQHLPDMPSEAEVAKDGLNLGEMNKLLVKKVEELTLYLIEKDKKDKDQSKTTEALEIRLKQQQEQIDELKAQMKSPVKH